MRYCVAFMLFFLSFMTFPAQASALPQYFRPDTGAITQQITPKELSLIARWEDGPLFLGDIAFSTMHYPPTDNQMKHATGCNDRPECLNGCTFGFGFNFGAHRYGETIRMLRQVMPLAEAKNLARKYAGKTGTDAVAACGNHVADRPTLTRARSIKLLKLMAQQHKNRVIARARREGLVSMRNGRDTRHHLSAGQIAVLVAVDYTCETCVYKATNLWKQLKRRDFQAVERNIRFHSGSRKVPALQTRRHHEADHFAWATTLSKVKPKPVEKPKRYAFPKLLQA